MSAPSQGEVMRSRRTSWSVGIVASLVVASLTVSVGHQDDDALLSQQGVEIETTGVQADPSMLVSFGDESVKLGSSDKTIKVELPSVMSGNTGSARDSGSVTYDAADGTQDVIVRKDDGVQFMKVIDDASDPTVFDYPLELPPEGRIELTKPSQDIGSKPRFAALVFDANDDVVATVDAPWAVDAEGRDIPTHFTVSGSVLTQHVDHAAQASVYPIIADPYFHWYDLGVVITLSHAEMEAVAVGGLAAAQALFGIGIVTVIGFIPASTVTLFILHLTAVAAWGAYTRNCLWFWIPNPLLTWDDPGHGYYEC
jgi:hypothetical protein